MINSIQRRWHATRDGLRLGFTLTEVLIMIAIVGLLLSLSVPAVQHAREASRRFQCASNLHQIGVALQNYQQKFLGLPPSMIWGPPGEPLGMGLVPIGVVDRVSFGLAPASEPDRVYANWAVMLLPYLDEMPLYKAFDLKVPMHDPRNETARSTEVALMKCPSDPHALAKNHFQRAENWDLGYARGNYAMNFGTNQSCLMRLSKQKEPIGGCIDGFQVDGSSLISNTRRVWGSGVGGVNRSVQFREFESGLTKTVAVEEVRAGVNPLDRRGTWALGFVGSSVTAGHGIHGDDGGPNNQNDSSDDIQGCIALVKKVGKSKLTLERMPCSSTSDPHRELSLQATARSQHPDGVQILMADGSVHFVEDLIDQDIWHNMHKRDRQAPFELPF